MCVWVFSESPLHRLIVKDGRYAGTYSILPLRPEISLPIACRAQAVYPLKVVITISNTSPGGIMRDPAHISAVSDCTCASHAYLPAPAFDMHITLPSPLAVLHPSHNTLFKHPYQTVRDIQPFFPLPYPLRPST